MNQVFCVLFWLLVNWPLIVQYRFWRGLLRMCRVKMNFMNEDCEIDFDEILQETIVDVSVGQKIPENAAIIFTQEDYFPVKGIHTRIH